MAEMRVLWLRPSTGENVSVRRRRIAEHLAEMGVDVELRDASGVDLPGAIWTALTGEYDVLVGNVRIGLYAGYPIARLLRKPFVGDVSDPITDINDLPAPLFWFFSWYERQVLTRADEVVFVHEESIERASEYGIDGVKLPNAVDYEAFSDPAPDVVAEARSILETKGVDLERPIAIYVGSFVPHYHIEAILDAARSTPTWEFVFVGEGDLEPAVAEAAEELSNVHYPGAFEYRLMPGFLSQATAGLCLADHEQPLKLKEYGAAGLATIVPDGTLNRWFSTDELLFVEPTSGSITDVLTELRTSNTLTSEYGSNLQDRAHESSWTAIAEGYYDIFKGLCDDWRNRS